MPPCATRAKNRAESCVIIQDTKIIPLLSMAPGAMYDYWAWQTAVTHISGWIGPTDPQLPGWGCKPRHKNTKKVRFEPVARLAAGANSGPRFQKTWETRGKVCLEEVMQFDTSMKRLLFRPPSAATQNYPNIPQFPDPGSRPTRWP